MSNFLLLYSGGSGMPETEAEGAAVLKTWMDWYGQLGAAVVDGGNPTSPVAKLIASDGTVSAVPAEMMCSGYTIITADSLDAAVEMSRGCPVLQADGRVAVFETFNAM